MTGSTRRAQELCPGDAAFRGLSIEETAAALGIARNTVLRDWKFARAWLRRELGGERLAKSEAREAD